MGEQQLEREKEKLHRRLLPGGRWLLTLLGVAALFLLAGFVLGQGVGANTGMIPGSEQDPLVTASWVEAKLNAFAQALKEEQQERQKLEDRMRQIEGVERPLPAQPGAPIRIVEPAPVYTVVVVEAGKKMLTGEGTEFILRSGRARAVVPIEGTGLVNLTTGKNLVDGDPIERDQLLLSPRDDGRGIITETQAIFLVKSKYRIV
ncbi:MAG: hypothetical protein AB1796_02385 [Bacillota bacterium]